VTAAVAAGPSARVRAALGGTGDVWVGQKLTLVVELLAPGYFASSPVFDLPQVAGILILPPTDRPVVGTETVEGISYTVQRHELAVFARRAGGFDIPPFTVRFDFTPSAGGAGAVAQAVRTEPLRFTANLPPGAEGLRTLVSARSLTAEETWQPQAVNAKAGDALTRTITFSAADVPGMAFPPFRAVRVQGLGVYARNPEVLDHSERGALVGRRRETITYVCERPGHFVIPAAHFTWWNLDDQRLETIDFPERVVDVAANPAFAAVGQAGHHARERHLRRWLLATATLLVVAAVLVFALARLWWRVAAYFEAVHLAPLNPQAASHGAASHHRAPIDQGRAVR
jgi:hypothetical protein